MRVLVVMGLLIGVVSLVFCWATQIGSEATLTAERATMAATNVPRFATGCAPAVRLATNDLCAFQN